MTTQAHNTHTVTHRHTPSHTVTHRHPVGGPQLRAWLPVVKAAAVRRMRLATVFMLAAAEIDVKHPG